jgi:hypothetical protein
MSDICHTHKENTFVIKQFRWETSGECRYVINIKVYRLKQKYSLTHSLTHSQMELSPSWGAAKCAATQGIPNILWNPKVHYLVHQNPPPVPIFSQSNPIHTIPSHPNTLRSVLILSTHLHLGLHSCHLLGFPPISFMQSTVRAACSAHLTLLDLIILIILGEEYS